MTVKLFTTLLRASDSLLHRTFEDNPLKDQVSQTEFAILEALYFKGALHQREVAQKILKSKGNISLAVQHLVQKGLVYRVEDPTDRRHTQVSLSEEGQGLIAELYARVSGNIETACQVLSDEELETYIGLNKKLGLGETKDHES